MIAADAAGGRDAVGHGQGVNREEKMRTMRKVGLVALLWIVATSAALADEVVYRASLQPSSEVPPTTSRGSGEVKATFDTSSRVLKWVGSFQGLSGPATGAHFQGPAPVGQTAGVQIDAPVPKAPAGSIEGQAMLTDTQINDLETAKWYVNIYTDKHKDGEIRGQLLPSPSASR